MGMDHAHDLTALTDEELLERSLKVPSAFEVLVARYQKKFLERAMFVVKNRDDAEDIVQDAFVRMYRFASRFNGEAGNFQAWAMTILMNVARTRYQKRAKEWLRTAPLTPDHYESLAEPSDQDATLAKDVVERLLTRVPDDVARLMRLAFLEGLAYKEIATKEGMSEAAVKTRIHRAKKVLRGLIKELEL